METKFLNETNFIKIGIFASSLIFLIFTAPGSIVFEKFGYSYHEFDLEDGPIEYTQSIFLFCSFIVSILVSNILFRKDKKKLGIFYLILGFVFLLGGFEEISWGQRILDIETPEEFSENIQGELNFHNFLDFRFSNIVYVLIAFYVVLALILFPKKRNDSYQLFREYLIPRWYFAVFFIPIILLSVAHLFEYFLHWEIGSLIRSALLFHKHEFFELLVSAGIFLFVSNVFINLKSTLNTTSNKRIFISVIILILIPSFIFIFTNIPEYVTVKILDENNLSDIYLSGIDFSDISLSGKDLSGANLSNVDLSGKDLSGTILVNSNLSGANLSNVDLSGKDLSGANLSNVDLSVLDISMVSLSGTNLSGTNLSNVDLSGLDLNGVNLSGADLSGKDLSGADLSAANLEGANLSKTLLANVNFIGANLTGVDLSGIDLSTTIFLSADLSGANLTGVNLSGKDLDGVIFFETILFGANLENATLSCFNHQICN